MVKFAVLSMSIIYVVQNFFYQSLFTEYQKMLFESCIQQGCYHQEPIMQYHISTG